MPDIFHKHREGFWTPERKQSLYMGILVIALSIVIQITAGRYSSRHVLTASPEGDIFLDNLPIVNLGFVIVGAAVLFWTFSFFLLSLNPRELLFGLKAVALFIIVRALFINLTREGIYPGSFLPGPTNTGYSVYHLVTYQGNLFFSGHTGFPFLMALIFWRRKFWRQFFLTATVFFGASVLLAHVHYSIDVFAAPFIVYGIFALAATLFRPDYELLAGSRRGSPI